MKQMFYSVIALIFVFFYSCSNHELEDFQGTDIPKSDVSMLSRSAGEIDYSQYTLLENRTIMPRVGQTYSGTITYHGADFPIYIFWDPDFEYYNLYAYINGVVNTPFIPGNVKRYTLQHVATYDSESTHQLFWFVIKCNYIIEYYTSAVENRYVSFRVTFNPNTQQMNCDVLEEGYGFWGDPDLD